MVKVSVIVPVYNVEPYLDKCLNGLVNQTLKDIEIIVVNDGATDNSQQIIDRYAKQYDNVISLVKQNGGLSDARNYGIPYATGEYIGFIDSDDFMEYDMFEVLYKKESDVLASDGFINDCHKKGLILWSNAMSLKDTEILAAGYDDNAYIERDVPVWEWHFGKKFDIVQTDWMALWYGFRKKYYGM